MNWWEYLIVAFCILFVIGVIVLAIVLKRRGKSLLRDCTGNCESCNKSCSPKQREKILEEYRKTYKK